MRVKSRGLQSGRRVCVSGLLLFRSQGLAVLQTEVETSAEIDLTFIARLRRQRMLWGA